MAAVMKGLVSVVFVIFLFSYAVSLPVPVLVWSNQSLPSLGSPALAGHSLSFSDFKSQVVDQLLSQRTFTLVVLVFDRLSVDDFTVYGGFEETSTFSHLQHAVETSPSSFVFPSVDIEYNKMISYLKGKDDVKVQEILPREELKVENLKPDEKNLVIIHMDPVADARDEALKKILSKNDKMIAELSEKISKITPEYTILLTAQRPSEVINEKQNEAILKDYHIRTGRHLLEAASPDSDKMSSSGTLIKGKDCILFYLQGMKLQFEGKENGTVDFMNSNLTFTTDAVCANKSDSRSASLTVNMTSSNKTIKSASLEFTFNKTNSDWHCNTIKMKLDLKKKTSDYVFGCSSITAAPPFSFHCSPTLSLQSSKSKNETVALQLSEIQVQVFGLKNGKFSSAQDCVGFFTLPILMGLFSVSILVTILLGGLIAMMGIQTMDRFDDPKGPVVNLASEN